MRERENYAQLNADFQRIARRDKKASNGNAKKERKIIDWERLEISFKKIGDTKETFRAKMGMIKDKNGRDLTKIKEIKKRWQKYTEELYENDLNVPDNHSGVITDLKLDILECEIN